MRTASRSPTIPGPKGWARVPESLRLFKDPLGVLARGFERYGDFVEYGVGPMRFVLVSDPDAIHYLLVKNPGNYHKSPTYKVLKHLLGDGLVTSEGEFWRRQRKLAQPAFHHQRLVGFVDTMARCTQEMLDRWAQWEEGKQVDAHQEMLALTLRTAGHTLFTTELAEETASVYQALEVVLERAARMTEVIVPLPFWLPTPQNRRYLKAKRTLDAVVLSIIERRRQRPEAGEDLLGLLMSATDETGTERMSDNQLRDEVMTLFLAGHETVANALSWTWYLLSRHPEVRARLAGEVQTVLGNRMPRYADLKDLVYTERVVQEVMRLYPPAWMFERQALKADTIAGFPIPAKTLVGVCTSLLHRHPAHWDEPDVFDPDRFAPPRAEGRHRFAYLPFGGGPRRCIGNAFAMVEAKVMVAMIVQRHRLRLVPGRAIEPEPGVTLRPRGGMPMTVHASHPVGARLQSAS